MFGPTWMVVSLVVSVGVIAYLVSDERS
jgi:hypothetical protein